MVDSSTSFKKPINTNVSVFDAAFPGVIPVFHYRNCIKLIELLKIKINRKII